MPARALGDALEPSVDRLHVSLLGYFITEGFILCDVWTIFDGVDAGGGEPYSPGNVEEVGESELVPGKILLFRKNPLVNVQLLLEDLGVRLDDRTLSRQPKQTGQVAR